MSVESTPVARPLNPVAEPDRARLEAFRIPGVVNQSEHLLRTGRRHNYYIDVDLLLNDPAECELVTRWYVDTLWRIRSKYPGESLDLLAFLEKDRDSGGTVGVLRLAGAVSIGARTPNIVVRAGKEILAERIKIGRDDRSVPLRARLAGYNVALCTDHCTSGHEALRAASVVSEHGGTVTHLLTYSLIAPEFQWGRFQASRPPERGVQVHHFLRAPDDLYDLDLASPLGFEIKQD